MVVNWNGFPDSVAALESLQRASPGPDLVVVVDNGSTDGSGRKLAAWAEEQGIRCAVLTPGDPIQSHRPTVPRWPRGMALVLNPQNSGFGAGVNLGIRAAAAIRRPHYVLLLNNDATVAPDFLPPLLEELSDPAVAAATGLIYHACGEDASRNPKLWYAGGRLDPIRALGVHRTKPLSDGACDVQFVTGCFVALKLDVLERYGLLPERYFLYSEDVELSFVLRRAGYRLRITPRAVAYHKVNAAAKHWRESPLIAYLHNRNRFWFARRNLSGPARILSFAWLVPSRLGRAAVEALTGRPKIAREVIRGTLHGLLTRPR